MLYLEDLKIGDRFISREYEITLDEIKNLQTPMTLKYFTQMKSKLSMTLFFRGLLQVVGIRQPSLCVYGQNACQFMAAS